MEMAFASWEDNWPPGTDDGAREMLASRLLPDGSGEDGCRHTLRVGAFAIEAGAQLGRGSGALASTGHIECSAVAAKMTCRWPPRLVSASSLR
jgi:hypothetical protein